MDGWSVEFSLWSGWVCERPIFESWSHQRKSSCLLSILNYFFTTTHNTALHGLGNEPTCGKACDLTTRPGVLWRTVIHLFCIYTSDWPFPWHRRIWPNYYRPNYYHICLLPALLCRCISVGLVLASKHMETLAPLECRVLLVLRSWLQWMM